MIIYIHRKRENLWSVLYPDRLSDNSTKKDELPESLRKKGEAIAKIPNKKIRRSLDDRKKFS